MNVTLCSAFRNTVPYLPRYFAQIDGLDHALYEQGHKLTFVWGEGDSADGTKKALLAARYRFQATVVDCTHGGKVYGSVVNVQRFRQLAYVGRRIFAAIPDDADVVVYCESDLVWEPATLVALIERVASGECAVIAPMVFLRRDGWPVDPPAFYDVFAYRADGQHFTHQPPYHPAYVADRPFQVDSVGSCVVMRGEIARRLIFDEQTIFPDLCRQIRAGGDSVWVDPTLACYHH